MLRDNCFFEQWSYCQTFCADGFCRQKCMLQLTYEINPFIPSGIFFLNSLYRSVFCLRVVWLNFVIIFCRNIFLMQKKCKPWSDAAFSGVWSGSTLFAIIAFEWTLRLNGLTRNTYLKKELYQNWLNEYERMLAFGYPKMGSFFYSWFIFCIRRTFLCMNDCNDKQNIQYNTLNYINKWFQCWLVIKPFRLYNKQTLLNRCSTELIYNLFSFL